MRKRLENLSKRCMVAIMSAVMLMSSVTVSMAFPVGVYAGEVYETTSDMEPYGYDEYYNEDMYRVEQGDTLKLNNEELKINSGTVKVNESYIHNNEGTVETNNGRVNLSSGEVAENNGTVNNNKGTIVTNGANGIVTCNFNTVTTNYGTVTNTDRTQGTGTVVNNFGTVNSFPTGGNVTNNYGGTVAQTINVANQFWAVNCDMLATPEFGTGFVSSPDENDTNNYIQVTSNGSAIVTTGTVTITTDSEHEIETQDQTNATGTYDTASFTYSLTKQADGKITVTITSLDGNICLTEENLGILIKEIQKNNNIPARPVRIVQENDDGLVVAVYEDADTAATAPAGIVSLVPVRAIYIGGRGTTIFAPAFKQDLATLQALPGAGQVVPVYYEKTTSSSPAAAAALQGAAMASGLTLLGDRMMTGKTINSAADLTASVDMPLPAGAAGRDKYDVYLVGCFPGGETFIIENAPDAPAGIFRCNFPLRFCSYMFAVR